MISQFPDVNHFSETLGPVPDSSTSNPRYTTLSANEKRKEAGE